MVTWLISRFAARIALEEESESGSGKSVTWCARMHDTYSPSEPAVDFAVEVGACGAVVDVVLRLATPEVGEPPHAATRIATLMSVNTTATPPDRSRRHAEPRRWQASSSRPGGRTSLVIYFVYYTGARQRNVRAPSSLSVASASKLDPTFVLQGRRNCPLP